jgi:hypothetical protein
MADAYSACTTCRRRGVVVALHSQPAGGLRWGAVRWDGSGMGWMVCVGLAAAVAAAVM